MLANRVESRFEEWKQQGLEQGREKGLQQGLQHGELSGRAALLEKLLRLKFNGLDNSIIQRLHSTNAEELDLWAERVLFAHTLEEVIQ
ncbi:MAG: hypothetical protein KIG85_04115 [Thiopseudomonas sp.]|nr:hypothetical protein [Thiopseudomonas sp.]